MFAGKRLMNGERRGTATGAAMLRRPGPDFGPTWPEVTNYFVVGWLTLGRYTDIAAQYTE